MLASQRVCHIPEIIHRIVSEFGPEPQSIHMAFPGRHLIPIHWVYNVYWTHSLDNRKILAILARCNKEFAEIALEILWRMQISIVPLLSLIPSFKRGRKKYGFTDAIGPASWKRVESYARHIRMIYSFSSAEIEDYVFVQLAQRLKDKPLLPRLHSLSYPISTEIFLFITPSLRRVNIAASPGRNKGPFLSALLETAPLLEEFSMEAFSAPFLKILSKFSRLKMMDIGNGKLQDIATLNRVFSCTHLAELRVCLADFGSDTEFENNLVAPFLRKLTLEGDPASIRTVLMRLGSIPLTALRIEYGDEGKEAQWRVLLNLVATWSSSLEILEVEDDGQYDAEDTLTPSIMDQLLQMTRLKHVKLNFQQILEFDDVYMNKIARAWTRLRSLDIRFFGGVTEPLTTIASLEAFATHCPHLHSLSLRISLQPSNLEPSPRCILSHGLQRLFIQYPIAGDTALIARHLLALFPCLQNVDGDDGDSADSEDCEEDEWKEWDEVQNMIRLCQATVEDNKMRKKKPW